MDRLSNEICTVIDSAELCRNSHTNGAFRVAAEEAFSRLSSYIQDLNQDDTLYYLLKRIVGNEKQFTSLTQEEQIFALDMKLEFEREGIHLNGNGRKICAKYHKDIVKYESLYIQNMNGGGNEYFEVGPVRDSSSLARLRAWLSQYTDQNQASSKQNLRLTSNIRISNTLIRNIPEEDIRKQIFEKSAKYPIANQEVLGNLIKSRCLLAQVLGFESHVEKYLKNKVMKSSEEVQKLLSSTASLVHPKVEKEVNLLMDLKKMLHEKGGGGTKLQPWDLSYLMDVDQAVMNSKRTNQINLFAEISKYLTLSSSIHSLFDISNDLFGISFQQQTLNTSERWDEREDSLLKYLAIGPDGEEIGYVFLDLFRREKKFPNAAHFTVRCGCKTGSTSSFTNKSIQTPVVALLFNFTPNNTQSRMDSLISYTELEVLYHEWGHALHSLLSRTTFQHLSGTRGSTDFVEVPSHLFEYFARDSRVLSKWAKHYQTKTPLPAHFIEEANETKNRFAGIDILTQVMYSSIDQFAFSTDLGDVSTMSGIEVYDKLGEGISMMRKEKTGGLANEFISVNLLTHSHFTNYGGGYYSYLLARMYAAQIWNKRFDVVNQIIRIGAPEQNSNGKLKPKHQPLPPQPWWL